MIGIKFKSNSVRLLAGKLHMGFILVLLLLVSGSETSSEYPDNGSGDEPFNVSQTDVTSVRSETPATRESPNRGISAHKCISLASVKHKIFAKYDDTAAPGQEKGEPTIVDVNLHLLRMGSFDAAKMEYTVDIYLRQSWTDPRLRLSEYGIHTERYFSGGKYMDLIWKPDTFFLNAKSANFHDVTMSNKFLKISPSGSVFTSLRLFLRLSCPMVFHRFPLDTQNCSISFGSFANPTKEVILQWREENPLTAEDLIQPEFEIVSKTPLSFLRQMNITGNFSFLRVEFILARRSGFHLVQTYLPTFLIVTISWVSFWLNADATPARVTLGVTTLLALTTVASGIRTKLPPVSYVKAIDVWIGTCSIMVFGALLEFTLVNYLSRSNATPKAVAAYTTTPVSQSQLKPDDSDIKGQNSAKDESQSRRDLETSFSEYAVTIKKYNEKRAKKVDRASRFLFPFVFLVFNITYWIYYLYLAK